MYQEAADYEVDAAAQSVAAIVEQIVTKFATMV